MNKLTAFNYKIYPADISKINYYEPKSDSSGLGLIVLGMASFTVFVICAICNFFPAGIVG